MAEFDRLTALMDRFTLRVLPAAPEDASLIVSAHDDGRPWRVCFRPCGEGFGSTDREILFAATVDWGGDANPLFAALPSEITFDLENDAETTALIAVLAAESSAQRCGAATVVNRLGEVLIVRLLRAQIQSGSTQPGLVAGLSDLRLSRAIVAMHDQPGRDWRNEDLAYIAGLSLSRFAELFLATVGEPPAVYLRNWRLTLARQDVMRGDRVEAVARRYGYLSPEGFARAFKKRFGNTPIAQRPKSAA